MPARYADYALEHTVSAPSVVRGIHTQRLVRRHDFDVPAVFEMMETSDGSRYRAQASKNKKSIGGENLDVAKIV